MVSEIKPDDEVNALADQIARLEAHMIRTKPSKGSSTSLTAKPDRRSQNTTESGRVAAPPPNVVWR